MSDKPNKEIDKYCSDHSTPESEVLRELAAVTRESSEHSGMMVGHIEGAFLKLLVKISGAKRILEIGTFTGYSALAMAEGLPDDGILITCDIDKETSKIAHYFWQKSPHGKKIKQLLGPALETLKKLENDINADFQEKSENAESAYIDTKTNGNLFDMVFIDADKNNYPNYWKVCIPLVKKGGIIAIDNVLAGRTVLDPDSERGKPRDEFNKMVTEDNRVEVLMLPVRDGVTVAVKR